MFSDRVSVAVYAQVVASFRPRVVQLAAPSAATHIKMTTTDITAAFNSYDTHLAPEAWKPAPPPPFSKQLALADDANSPTDVNGIDTIVMSCVRGARGVEE